MQQSKKMPPAPPVPPDRVRIALDLSPGVAAILDRISDGFGVPRSQVVIQAVIDALPRLVERLEGLEAAVQRGKKR